MKRIDVVCAVIRKGNQYLVARRSKEPNQGLWEFPGGKVKHGESIKDALIREIDEELKIIVEPKGELMSYPVSLPNGEFILHFIESTYISKEPKSREHSEVRWITAETLRELVWVPGDIQFLREYVWKLPS